MMMTMMTMMTIWNRLHLRQHLTRTKMLQPIDAVEGEAVVGVDAVVDVATKARARARLRNLLASDLNCLPVHRTSMTTSVKSFSKKIRKILSACQLEA